MLYAFIGRMNRQRHPYLEMPILDVWLRGVAEMGGVVEIDPKSFDAVGKRFSRDLDGAGCFDFAFQGQRVWQVPGLHSCKVWVYQLLLEGGKLLVKDPADGKSYWPEAFTAPMPVGTYIGQPKTALNKLLDDPAYELPPATREDFSADLGNVLYLPPRTREIRPSGFEMPSQAGKPMPPATLEELAAGAVVVEHRLETCATKDEEIYASEVDWYAAMRVRELRGEALGAEALGRMASIREESRAYRMLRDGIEKRASLAAVE